MVLDQQEQDRELVEEPVKEEVPDRGAEEAEELE
jgi:hypothetical protein